MTNDSIRVNKYIAQHLSIGRRAADDLITSGKVLVNGKPPELGARIMPGDSLTVNGVRLNNASQPFIYLLFNKPKGYVCSRRQQGDTPTIYQNLPAKYQHLKAVGRLDKDSSGILLLTNDGDYAHQLTHPSFSKRKRYEVTLDKPLAPLHHQMINDHGITLPDGVSKLQLERQHDGNDYNWIVLMHEGRNRQIRRTFAALGYEVTMLHRTHFGPYSQDDLGGKAMLEVAKT